MFNSTGSILGLDRLPLLRAVAYAAFSASVLALAGCGATYGTGKTSEMQLLEDVSGVLALGPRNKEAIDYKPRPALVKPPSTAVLPVPQDNIASPSNNPAWPESPEQRLARVRADATANQNDPAYRSPVVRDMPVPVGQEETRDFSKLSAKEQRAEFKRRRAMVNQGDSTTRRYLSDPPLDYRQPSDAAPTDELGKDEAQKEREAKRAAKGGKGGGLGRLWPF